MKEDRKGKERKGREGNGGCGNGSGSDGGGGVVVMMAQWMVFLFYRW